MATMPDRRIISKIIPAQTNRDFPCVCFIGSTRTMAFAFDNNIDQNGSEFQCREIMGTEIKGDIQLFLFSKLAIGNWQLPIEKPTAHGEGEILHGLW